MIDKALREPKEALLSPLITGPLRRVHPITVTILASLLVLVCLLASFYINGASWMYLAALLEKRKAGAHAPGELTAVTMPSGLIEGAETIVLFTLFLLFPGALIPLYGLMALLVLITAGQRVVWAMQHLSEQEC